MLRRLFAASLALVLLGFAELPRPSNEIPTGGPVKGTPAAREFCTRLPRECLFDRSEARRIALTPKIFDQIVAINLAVNAQIRPKTDLDHWGVPDRWDYPDDGFGDCEDYQLEKRRRLIAAGLPKRALLMAVVYDHNNDGHAVLIVRTDLGDYVLDNLSPAVLGWHDTDYEFAQREDGLGGWIALNGVGDLR